MKAVGALLGKLLKRFFMNCALCPIIVRPGKMSGHCPISVKPSSMKSGHCPIIASPI